MNDLVVRLRAAQWRRGDPLLEEAADALDEKPLGHSPIHPQWLDNIEVVIAQLRWAKTDIDPRDAGNMAGSLDRSLKAIRRHLAEWPEEITDDQERE